MAGFLNIVVANTLIAAVLALIALSVTKVCRNPHLAHALWLLVLIKLVTPPIVTFPLEALRFADVPPAGTAEIVEVTLDDPSVTWPAPHGAPTAAVETFEPIEHESSWTATGSIAEIDTAENDEEASTSIDQGERNSDRVHAADDRSILPGISSPPISQQSFSSARISEEGEKDPGSSSEPRVRSTSTLKSNPLRRAG